MVSAWASSPSDVFAVGGAYYGEGTILHYDGKKWSKTSAGRNNFLYGVWGSSPSDVFAVGVDGVILHYNGKTWRKMKSGTDRTL
ncbi:MAG TPA: hypothetical protein VJK47_00915, partial [Dehalococcoidales bacterium]|nr:hypothetical protein [Dehalococcoidales bacterium]